MVIYLDNTFDIALTNDGYVRFEDDVNKYNTLAKFDITSNNNWALDSRIGVPWVTDNNDGIMQVKPNDYELLSAINAKITTLSYFKELEELALKSIVDGRTGTLLIKFKTQDNMTVDMEVA